MDMCWQAPKPFAANLKKDILSFQWNCGSPKVSFLGSLLQCECEWWLAAVLAFWHLANFILWSLPPIILRHATVCCQVWFAGLDGLSFCQSWTGTICFGFGDISTVYLREEKRRRGPGNQSSDCLPDEINYIAGHQSNLGSSPSLWFQRKRSAQCVQLNWFW